MLAGVRLVRLFELPAAASPTPRATTASSPSVGRLGAFLVSERCNAVEPPRSAFDLSLPRPSPADDLTLLSISDERILNQLPPSPSKIVDVRVQRATAAVLCESHEILLVNLTTMHIQQRIASLSSLAMALGTRWIAYPGYVPSALEDDSDSEDAEEIVPEALVNGGPLRPSRQASGSSLSSSSSAPSPSYTALDVAQNVASGIYFLSKSIAPYLSTSPGQSAVAPPTHQGTPVEQASMEASMSSVASASSSPFAGWIVVQDIPTGRVIANFQSHSSALVQLAFDPSGCLLASSSSKGQNVHVYRLLPPVQTQRRDKHDRPQRFQLLYKLQRGITHASIAEMTFSQDSKWISVTSAHGTSHLYAIHPEGAPISADTHATSNADQPPGRLGRNRDVQDFCAHFRPVETKTLGRVLKIHHATTNWGAVLTAATTSALSASVALRGGGARAEASQSLRSQLAQSARSDMDESWGDDSLGSRSSLRRRGERLSLSSRFASDGLKFLVCCDGRLSLYGMDVHQSSLKASPSGGSSRVDRGSESLCSTAPASKTRSSEFGFDATVAELKSLDLLEATRVRAEPAAACRPPISVAASTVPQNEIRTFAQRGLPLWAHPKVSFRVIDVENPQGTVLQVKRRGPQSQSAAAESIEGAATLHSDDQQLFVMEMDSYFGLGGSPIFTATADTRVNPEMPPPLDLAESINLAMSTSLRQSSRTSQPEVTAAASVAPAPSPSVPVGPSKRRGNASKRNKGRADPAEPSPSSSPDGSSASTSTSSSPSVLPFTFRDMYFVVASDASSS
ncbi:hypothetical protein P43SY_004129 [Pythium insidiosum]|uniref:BCAS3 WD40 domain-containing protein n=1 Tax=Pythium insidiosum TaxID=114742 RepID=A0AAD5M0J6_PYTIN|nr:hypothetical protein P43SY_004129 [Pythium insidiosum]